MRAKEGARLGFLGQTWPEPGTAWLPAIWPEILAAVGRTHCAASRSEPAAFALLEPDHSVVRFADCPLTPLQKDTQAAYTAAFAARRDARGNHHAGLDVFWRCPQAKPRAPK